MASDDLERDLEAHVGIENERAFFAGFMGVAFMIVWVRVSWLFGFPWPLDHGTLLSSMAIGRLLHTDTGAHFILGSLALVLLGTLVLARLYAQIYTKIPGPHEPSVRGLIFGIVLWLIAQVITAPLLGSMLEEGQPGFFSTNLGPMAAIGSLIGHVIYGLLLGVGYGHHISSRTAARIGAPASS